MLTRLFRMFSFKPNYNMVDLKSLENHIVRDILTGNLKFIKFQVPRLVCQEVNYISTCGRVKVRIDYAGIGGTFTFFYVQGKDLSYEDVKDFDYKRLVGTIKARKDPGPTKSLSLWAC